MFLVSRQPLEARHHLRLDATVHINLISGDWWIMYAGRGGREAPQAPIV